MTDCGSPVGGSGVVIEPFNDTKFDAVITFHCQENVHPAVCGSNGEWFPSPASLKCGVSSEPLSNCGNFCYTGLIVLILLRAGSCGILTAPVNGYIGNYSSTIEGSQFTIHCGGDSLVMTSTCSNGSWIPDPADLNC